MPQMACWTINGERQASRIRHLYLRSLLRQDVAFFDRGTRTGEVVRTRKDARRHSSHPECISIHWRICMGFYHWMASSCHVGNHSFCWCCCCFDGQCLNQDGSQKTSSLFRSRKAAATVEQTIGAIRTVAAFTGEEVI